MSNYRIILFVLFISLFSCKDGENENSTIDANPQSELTAGDSTFFELTCTDFLDRDIAQDHLDMLHEQYLVAVDIEEYTPTELSDIQTTLDDIQADLDDTNRTWTSADAEFVYKATINDCSNISEKSKNNLQGEKPIENNVTKYYLSKSCNCCRCKYYSSGSEITPWSYFKKWVSNLWEECC